jgi:hypothetical protein
MNTTKLKAESNQVAKDATQPNKRGELAELHQICKSFTWTFSKTKINKEILRWFLYSACEAKINEALFRQITVIFNADLYTEFLERLGDWHSNDCNINHIESICCEFIGHDNFERAEELIDYLFDEYEKGEYSDGHEKEYRVYLVHFKNDLKKLFGQIRNWYDYPQTKAA